MLDPLLEPSKMWKVYVRKAKRRTWAGSSVWHPTTPKFFLSLFPLSYLKQESQTCRHSGPFKSLNPSLYSVQEPEIKRWLSNHKLTSSCWFFSRFSGCSRESAKSSIGEEDSFILYLGANWEVVQGFTKGCWRRWKILAAKCRTDGEGNKSRQQKADDSALV